MSLIRDMIIEIVLLIQNYQFKINHDIILNTQLNLTNKTTNLKKNFYNKLKKIRK